MQLRVKEVRKSKGGFFYNVQQPFLWRESERKRSFITILSVNLNSIKMSPATCTNLHKKFSTALLIAVFRENA